MARYAGSNRKGLLGRCLVLLAAVVVVVLFTVVFQKHEVDLHSFNAIPQRPRDGTGERVLLPADQKVRKYDAESKAQEDNAAEHKDHEATPVKEKKQAKKDKKKKRTDAPPSNNTPEADSANRGIAVKLQKTEWELNTVKHSLGRHKVMLSEARDNMLDSYKHSREYIAKYESNILANRDVPCYCMELSAMAPQDSWCDNPLKGRLSGSHVCILNNVCVGAGKQLIFVSERSNSKSTSEHRRMSTAGVDIDGEVVYRGNPLYDEAKKAPVTEGTAVLYASKFAGHITHVQEGAGSLMLSIHRMKDRSPNCNRSDLTCFPKVSKFLFYNSGGIGNWQENILRVMINDQTKTVPFEDPTGLSARPLQCFEKAIVPGFYYSVFPSSEDVSQFQTQAREYIKRNAKFEESSNPVILLARRTTKRSVVDWDVFVSFVKEVAADYNKNGKAVTVEEIEYGRHSFEEQVSATAKADILMGLHGADLTNMMFMNRGSVLIEMNPLFFFESRFFEIAESLRLQYLAWTCTTEKCAFGGNEGHFRNIVGNNYDYTTRTFDFEGKKVSWPYDRYAGTACPECDRMSHSSFLAGSFMSFRDSDVKVGGSLDEIREVLEQAFAKVNWKKNS